MNNISTYTRIHKKTSFEEMPFSEVDGLVLCQASYYDYALKKEEGMPFQYAMYEYLQEDKTELLKYLLTINGDEELIDILKSGGRHGGLKVGHYMEKRDLNCDQQFSAITFKLDKEEYYIAFRGTDNSVVGWKEDFNMTYQNEIPAQKEAVEYAVKVMEQYPGRFFIGGHSKGGNLAVYTAMMLPEHLQERIRCIYNYDGPGFWDTVYTTDAYKKVRPYIRKIVPQTSIVGMLLECDTNYTVAKSTAVGFMQHNPFTWVVNDDRFEILKDVDDFSNFLKGTMNRWLQAMNMDEREHFVNTVFDVIGSTGILSFTEEMGNRKEKIRKLLNHLKNVDPEEIKLVFGTIGRFIQASAREMRQQNIGGPGKRASNKTKRFKI